MLDQQLTDLREAAEARGYKSRLDVLRSASITAATRAALHHPTAPMELFSGILPHPGAVIPTQEARLDEVRRQSEAQTCNRHLRLDHEHYAARCDTASWAPLSKPSLELPMVHRLALLRANLPPDQPSTVA